MSYRSLFIALALIATTTAIGGPKKIKSGKTHVGVPVHQIVHLETFNVDNDNSGGDIFYYDRQVNAPFSVPEGFSFIVTDLFVDPATVGVDDSKYYLTVVNLTAQGIRTYTAAFGGTDTHHVRFTGGMVIPGGTEPTARNTTSSATDVGVRMIGYFVKGNGLGGGVPAF